MIENSPITALDGEAKIVDASTWSNKLYREVSEQTPVSTKVRLIPYYAWSNRGHSEMEVWIPISR